MKCLATDSRVRVSISEGWHRGAVESLETEKDVKDALADLYDLCPEHMCELDEKLRMPGVCGGKGGLVIAPTMWQKAQAVIAADSLAAYRAAGNKPGRKHKPYSLPSRARDLVDALGRNDAEMVASILMFRGGAE